MHITPPPPNLRQVHLIPNEILAACDLAPGQIGENVTTVGIDLLALGKGTRLHFLPPAPSYNGNSTDGDGGDDTHEESEAVGRTDHPIVTIQGLRNPCPQIEKFRRGLQEMFIVRDSERRIVERKAGVMATVEVGGTVCVGMRVVVERAAVGGFVALGCV